MGYADIAYIAYIARHMRLPDRPELCAFDETENPEKLARELAYYERFHWCAFIDWRPVSNICAIEQAPTLWRVGMFSTDEWSKVALSCTRFFQRTLYPTLYDLKCNRAECRSIVSHTDTRCWAKTRKLHPVFVKKQKGNRQNIFIVLVYVKLEKFGREATNVFRRYNGKFK